MTQIDLAAEYKEPQKILDVLNKTKCENAETLKLIYERVKAHETTIYNSADHVRDKAKTMLGTASFTAAILFGVAALFITAIKGFPLYVLIIEFSLFVLQIAFFGVALYKSVKVMTREQIIKPSPDEILCVEAVPADEQLVLAYKNAISHVLAYANQTHEYIRQRVNMLIEAQRKFGYGLICFLLFFGLYFSFLFKYGPPDDGGQRLRDLEQRLTLKLDEYTKQETEALKGIAVEIKKLKRKQVVDSAK